jgi:hypothetical protein
MPDDEFLPAQNSYGGQADQDDAAPWRARHESANRIRLSEYFPVPNGYLKYAWYFELPRDNCFRLDGSGLISFRDAN